MSQTCHCYSCNILTHSQKPFSSNNEDKQNLILQICKRIFEAIQYKHTSTEISYNGKEMEHKQINNVTEVENCINEEFSQLRDNDKILNYEVKKLLIGIWRIEFKWTKSNINPLVNRLLEISMKWYDSFVKYIQQKDYQKRLGWRDYNDKDAKKGELKKYLLENLEKYLPGLEYLFEYSWISLDEGSKFHEGDFIFASDVGIFVVVGVKWLDVNSGPAAKKSIEREVRKFKELAEKKCKGKYIAIIGATFMNNPDEDSLDKYTLEFIESDKIIAQILPETHQTRSKTKSTLIQQEQESSGWSFGGLTGLAAIAATGLQYLHHAADFAYLRGYLRKNYNKLTWKEKINITVNLISFLSRIHKENAVHRDLHSGNILFSNYDNEFYISDLGFCGPINKPLENIYGNLPYIAPEVLTYKKYSYASDIYSIGILMWEISFEQSPFIGFDDNLDLTLKIINGMRPRIISNIPLKYEQLMKQCWDADPLKRPCLETLFLELYKMKLYYQNNNIQKANSNNTNSKLSIKSNSKIHNIYKGLYEPRNAFKEEQKAYNKLQLEKELGLKIIIGNNINNFDDTLQNDSLEQYMILLN
ncbi:3094_t:CDS:2 [Funneliformis geosporum]|uniref:3094_t:CDS:1 n=1 Tax=Funneliformis geosporum TaxID=1117311 RepID=A0A9W4SGZ7_9GLOM|nr:3094_t:CDS:2 [Funneliformis geosporum]